MLPNDGGSVGPKEVSGQLGQYCGSRTYRIEGVKLGNAFLTRLGSSCLSILAYFGGPREAQIELKSVLGPSGEALFCLTWRLEGF